MKLKKSETLEIRIPYPTKEAFMAKCRTEGHSASEALRRLIDGDLNRTARQPAPRRGLRLAAGAMLALAVGAVALPTLARTDSRAEFRHLDANGDGQLSLSEYSQRPGAIAFFTAGR